MDKTQLIFWIVIVVVALVKWLYENADAFHGGGLDDTPESRPSRPAAPRSMRPGAESESRGETDEEKMRRFMEALGLPPGGAPPVPRKPAARPEMKRPAPPVERPVFKAKPEPRTAPRPHIAPPLETGEPLPVLPKTASVAETAPAMEVASIPKMTFAPQAAVSSAGEAVSSPKLLRSSVLSAQSQRAEPADMVGGLVEQLRDPASLRRAILLKEILGMPKGLQSAESLSIFSPL